MIGGIKRNLSRGTDRSRSHSLFHVTMTIEKLMQSRSVWLLQH
jgi:hypothetical protein